MKKLLLLIGLFAFTLNFYAQKSTARKSKPSILKSKDIVAIEKYLKDHPSDKNYAVLNQRLTTLKKEKVLAEEKAKALKFQPESVPGEEEEFARLMAENKVDKAKKTENTLNSFLDSSKKKTDAVIYIQNKSNCNIIVRIAGSRTYNLPVPARGENSIVVEKGDYDIKSNICDAQYVSHKQVKENIFIGLNKS
ncbi:MAG: hypothetical protein KBA33_03370 [Cloacibacterium sp.]|nr:hypothetical protein [Cloacibacterium sp.]